MTPAELKAKASALTVELLCACQYFARNTTDKYAGEQLQEESDALAVFITALISVIDEAKVFIPGQGCMCKRCASYRTALSRLEELLK